MPKKDPCKVFACRIQSCLKDNNYQESACQEAIQNMRDCCKTWFGKSFVCEGMNVDAPTKGKN